VAPNSRQKVPQRRGALGYPICYRPLWITSEGEPSRCHQPGDANRIKKQKTTLKLYTSAGLRTSDPERRNRDMKPPSKAKMNTEFEAAEEYAPNQKGDWLDGQSGSHLDKAKEKKLPARQDAIRARNHGHVARRCPPHPTGWFPRCTKLPRAAGCQKAEYVSSSGNRFRLGHRRAAGLGSLPDRRVQGNVCPVRTPPGHVLSAALGPDQSGKTKTAIYPLNHIRRRSGRIRKSSTQPVEYRGIGL